MKKAVLIILVVLLSDQILKIWVKTNMFIGESHPIIGSFFQLHFIENNGMAFGMELFGGVAGKLVLSVFRIVALVVIAVVMRRISVSDKPFTLLVAVALIFAGALGNILDSAFYGLIFDASLTWPYQNVASFFPESGGYAPFLQGKVVDMFHFGARWPEWIPMVGGNMIFPPVFNLADTSISVGVGLLFILMLRKKI
jgi:signal peptidase II